MLRVLLAVGVLSLSGFPSASSARAEPPVPTLEVRVNSLNRLVERLPTLGEAIGQQEGGRQLAGLVQALTDPEKGLEGFDPTRPAGMYTALTAHVIDSPVVGLLPVRSETAILALMTEKLGLKPEPQQGGRYQVALPNLPFPVYFRFAHRYLYVTVMKPDGIEPRRLIPPDAFFPNEFTGLFTAVVHLDRIPKEVSRMVLGQFELRTAEAKDEAWLGPSPAQRNLWQLSLEAAADLLHLLIRDGKTVSIQLDINTKTEELLLHWSLSGKPGSPLAQALANPRDPSRVYGITRDQPRAAATAYLNLGIPRAYLPAFADWFDLATEEFVARAKDSDKLGSRLLINALAPTAKSGRIDLGLQILGPNDQGKYTILAGFLPAEGKRLEETARLILGSAPKNELAVKLDHVKLPGINLHELRPLKHSADFHLFSHPAIWLATGESFFAVEFGGNGQHLRDAAERKPAEPPVADVQFQILQLLPLLASELYAEKLDSLIHEILGNTPSPEASAMQLQVRGGTDLTVEARVKAKALRLLLAVDEAKKQQ